jgi:metallo-beta-lactamase family protein
MSKPAITCYGGAGTVTGANFMLEVGDKKYLIDCGLLQGVSGADEQNASKFEYDVKGVEALFVTHAHADHIGRILRLVNAGFTGEIYSTPATRDISEIMLHDLANIEDLDYALVDRAMRLWKVIPYYEKRGFNGFTLEILDSGHILGSGMLKFIFPSGRSVLFTGDLGNTPSPLLKPTDKVEGVQYILMESVYGNRNHDSAEVRDERLRELVRTVVEEGKTLIVPVFSLERTQLMLYELHKLYEEGTLKNTPVFLDSPLAIRLTSLYEKILGEEIFNFPMLRKTQSAAESKEIWEEGGSKIILAGSGMSTAGRILFHEERYLPDPNAIILFVGFQAPGTLGRHIQEGMKEVSIDGNKVLVRAKVISIDGYSAHAGSDQLVDFVSHSKDSLEKVFVAMGEPKSSIFLAQRLHDELGVDALVPERLKRYELDL